MPNPYSPGNHQQNKTPGDTQNIFQLDAIPCGITMDSHIMGDHDTRARIDPFGDLANRPGDLSFVRQLGPIMGGKRVDDEEGTFTCIDHDLNIIQHSAPILGTKRQDESGQDQVGLDPSRSKIKMD